MVAVAGCSGGNGPSETETDATATDTDAPADTDAPPETTVQDGGTDPGTATQSDETSGSSLSYQWTEGESYTYEASSEQSGTSTYSWTVTDVSDGQVTVNITSAASGQTRSSTFSGPQGAIFSGDSQNLQALTFVIVQVPQQLVAGRTLEVGNSWTLSSEELSVGAGSTNTATPQTVRVEVTGTSQVAGTQCYDVEASSDAQDSTLNACVKQGWPFALSLSSTGGGENTMTGTLELTGYERP
jgi:hypothetical protein